jgi:tight adherence protein B
MSYIAIFVIILLAVFAAVAFFTEPSEGQKRLRQRLSGLDHRLALGGHEEGIVKHVSFSSIPMLDRLLRAHRLGPRLHLMLEQAKVPWSVGRFFFFSLGMVLVGAIIGNLWISASMVVWVPAVALGVTPLVWLRYKRAARFHKFNLQLPDAIDLMSRTLRAGHALPSSLLTVADEMADPLGTEFRRVADELNFGLPFREALLNMNQRFPLPDLNFLVSAILVQKETGGNLAELLDKTAAVLRSRIQLQQKIRVYTAQGRMTGAILLALPFLCFFVLNLIKPDYGAPLISSDLGRKMLYMTGVSMVMGFLAIRRIIRVKY